MPTSHVVVREPGEFIASLPSMLGFVPERSLVVALLDQPTAIPLAGRARVAVVIRIDLDDSLGDFADVVGQVCAQTSCVAALLVLVDDRLDVPPTGPLRQYTASQRALIKALGYQLADFGIAVNGAWASRRIGADNPWWSLLGPSR